MNSQEKINDELDRAQRGIEEAHEQYLEALVEAAASLEREIAKHREAGKPITPATSINGALMCGDLTRAQRASDDLAKHGDKVRLLKWLQKDG